MLLINYQNGALVGLLFIYNQILSDDYDTTSIKFLVLKINNSFI
jgi:hypothetical protein